jgi:uncharacterized protein (TIGR04255 family)
MPSSSKVKFAKAPLSEVVCGVEFDAPSFASVHFGLYWSSIQDRFPDPPIDQRPLKPKPNLDKPELRRVWFESRDREQMIQLEDDRFYFNWRRISNESDYPHFDTLYSQFSKEWSGFQEWWTELDNLPVSPKSYELSYINQIDASLGWKSVSDTFNIFSFIDLPVDNSSSLKLEAQAHILSFALPDNKGRLVIHAGDGQRRDDLSNVLVLRITAQSLNTDTPMCEWFEVAHDSIIETFLQILSKTTKERWGLT